MKIIYKPMQMGKTYDLVKQADNYNGYIITMNKNSCEHTMELAKKHNFKINFPLTLDEFLNKKFYSKGVKKVYFDNVDLMLQSLAYARNVSIEAITLTSPDYMECEHCAGGGCSRCE